VYTAIEDARTLGLSDRIIEQQLKEAKVANYKQVMRGIFKPIEASPDLVRASKMRGTTNINPSVLPIAQQKMRQDLQGKFLNPLEPNAQQRAAQVLREEEERKILGTP
jgi:hypothetical protein